MRVIPSGTDQKAAGPSDPVVAWPDTGAWQPALSAPGRLGLDLRADDTGQAPDLETTRQAFDCMLSASGADREVSVVIRLGRQQLEPGIDGMPLVLDAGEIAETVESLIPFARQSAAERGKTVALSLAVDGGTDGDALAALCRRWKLELVDEPGDDR